MPTSARTICGDAFDKRRGDVGIAPYELCPNISFYPIRRTYAQYRPDIDV